MIIQADTLEWVKNQPDKFYDHIITDYEYGTLFPIREFMRICRGTILTFCQAPEQPLGIFRNRTAYWIKTPSTKNTQKNLSNFVEEIHICTQYEHNVFNTNLHWSNYTGVYTDLVEEKGWYWKKPLSLMERLVRIFTNTGDMFIDPYCGSGTTLEACKKWGRSGYGIDKDPKWVIHCKGKGL